MKRKIIYNVSYDYLSVPVFNSYSKILGKDYKHVLDYFPDPFITQDNTNIWKKIEDSFFDEVLINDFSEINLINELLKEQRYIKNYLKIIYYLKKFKSKVLNLLSEISPDIIVVTSDLSFISRIFSEYSKDRDIPFILIQPSFLLSPHKSKYKKLRGKILYYLFNGMLGIPLFNRQEQWGDESRDSIKLIWGDKFKGLIKSENVHIVGNPAIRNYQNIDYTNGKIIKAKLGIKSETPVITICTEGFGGMIDEEQVNNIYKETIINTPEYHFIIKVHPRDEISFYEKYFTGTGINNISVINEIPLLDIYSFTDVQLSVNSYSSLEAILCGIPVILVKRELLNQVNYFDDAIILNSNDTFSLKQNLKRCLNEEYKNEFMNNREKFISRLFDGMNPVEVDQKILNVFGSLKKHN